VSSPLKLFDRGVDLHFDAIHIKQTIAAYVNMYNKCAARANNTARGHAFNNLVIQEGGMFEVKNGVAYTMLLGPHLGKAPGNSNIPGGTAINLAASVKDAAHPG
jgi:hypothetical protein